MSSHQKEAYFLDYYNSNLNTVDIRFKKWKRIFTKALHACFKKIRVSENSLIVSKLDDLMNRRKEILKSKSKLTPTLKEELENIETMITNECADKEYEKLQKVLGNIESAIRGTNNTNIWKEMRKAFPNKTKPLPTGVKKHT